MEKFKPLIKVDQYGLPFYEDCDYIRINRNDTDKVKELLNSNKVNNAVYADAMLLFCENEAEFRLRSLLRSDYGNITEENKIHDIALESRAEFGRELLDNGEFILDNDFITDLAYGYLEFEGFISYDEEGKKWVNLDL